MVSTLYKSPERNRINNSQDGSPPPPYHQVQDPSSSPLLLAETTTTTEVVTTTTTRFLFLPWKKRVISTSRTGPDAHTQAMLRPARSFVLDKALPPTPDESDEYVNRNRSQIFRSSPDVSLSAESSRPFPPNTDLQAPTALPATHALAQASLGLGFPHATPAAPIRPSTSAPLSSTGSPRPTLELLTPATAHNDNSKQRSYSTAAPPSPFLAAQITSRRSRGLSLGPASFLGLNSDSSGKEKQKEAVEQPSSSKGLTRRSSFWTRRKTRASTELAPIEIPTVCNTPPHTPKLPMLPMLTPLAPFDTDLRPKSPPATSSHGRGLSRSNSERLLSTKVHRPTPASGIDPQRSPLPTTKRPKTSDSAATRYRSRSFFGVNSPPSPLQSRQPDPIPPASPLPTPPSPVFNRPRSITNPPLLNRLSMTLFSSPAQSRSQDSPSTATKSAASSPRPSFQRPANEIPKPQINTESPEVYLNRLLAAVSKAEVAGILASSTMPFHISALQAYIRQFEFTSLPLDVALRKLLMDVGLPRETQQIDRVMEAFADRYVECNPGLFVSDDHPYILAFSLIMLHTDAFNKSNKRKMTKADYVKNARLPGVPPEVLDYFYDNIVFAPFIFIEDPVDVNGQRGLTVSNDKRAPGKLLVSNSGDSNTTSGPSLLAKGNKIDPYYLISQGMLDPLRVDVEQFVPMKNPYSCEGTAGAWDEKQLRRSFVNASTIEITGSEAQASPFFSLNVGSAPGTLMSSGLVTSTPGQVDPIILKVTKVGRLSRKDAILPGGKKAPNRKWRQLSVILTGSQLLLFRDLTWASALLSDPETKTSFAVDVGSFKPDELLSVKDAAAVYDASYTKYDNTFRFVKPDGRHILFKATDDNELNEWISCINYASAFKSAGIRMRAMGMSGNDVRLTGIAAATSHLHDLQHRGTPRSQNWDVNAPRELMKMLSQPKTSPSPQSSSLDTSVDTEHVDNENDIEVAVAPEIEGAAQFEVTFDQVKAELATGRWTRLDGDQSTSSPVKRLDSESASHAPEIEDVPPLQYRAGIVKSKVVDIEERITAQRKQLDTDMRFVRNVAALTPFQRSTHDRLGLAVQNIAGRIMQVRLDIARMSCHRHVLLEDLEAEKRDWHGSKKLALQVATETLQHQREREMPKLALSAHTTPNIASPLLSSKKSSSSMIRDPSICESFHSALDFGSEWACPSEELDALPSPQVATRNNSTVSLQLLHRHTDTSQSDFHGSTHHLPSEASSPPHLDATHEHEKFFTAIEGSEEEAEEWNKTRCAQRVSLVRLPSGNDISTLLQRHVHSFDPPDTRTSSVLSTITS